MTASASRPSMDAGLGVSFLTSKVARDVEQMAKIYGVPPDMLWGSSAKMARLDEFEKQSGLKDEDICYVGDEMIDLGDHETGLLLGGPRRRLCRGQGHCRPCDRSRRRQRSRKGARRVHLESSRQSGNSLSHSIARNRSWLGVHCLLLTVYCLQIDGGN